jgi:WD40 repeat protein
MIKKYFFLSLLVIVNPFLFHGFCQNINLEYEKFQVDNVQTHFSWIALSPDNQTLAISSTKSDPLYLFDWQKREMISTFEVGDWFAGPRIRYSLTGKLLLLQQLYYLDFAPNKDREVNFEILDAQTGKKIIAFPNNHDVVISPDDKYAISLSGDQVSFWNLKTQEKERYFDVPEATNALAISPDGKYLAVSHKTNAKELKSDSRYNSNKKNLDILIDYKQQITIYDAITFEKLFTVDEFYDIVYRLIFSMDSKYLFCHSVPNTKLQKKSNPKEGYVSVIDVPYKNPLRTIFPTTTYYFEPDFKLSPDMKFFGITSCNKYTEVHVYDFETGRMLYRFELDFRIIDKEKGERLSLDARVSFVFLPDNRSMIITSGNRLVLWKFEQ